MTPSITMRDALATPKLLGGALAGDSWSTWRTFLIAAMGEELTTDEREVFKRFTGRETEPGQRIEEALFLIGRRGGKDRATSVLAAYLAVFVDWSNVISKGEIGCVLIIAPELRQARIQRDYIEGVFESSLALTKLITRRTQDTLELSNGIVIEVRSASFRRLRGPTCVAVIGTEVSFWYDDNSSSNSDVEILNSVRPTLGTTQGPLILITTPYARLGATWEFYRTNFRPDADPVLLVVQGTSRDFNPTLSEKFVARALERDPAAAKAEYLAEFRDDISTFIRHRPRSANGMVRPCS
jgi:hypothetical protein